MKTWGLTGGIGTGKSMVLELFAALGDVTVVKTDDLAKKVLARDSVAEQVHELLGSKVLSEGKIDHQKLAERIFTNPLALAQVEALIHPLVWEEVDKIVRASQASFVVVESAVIFERRYENRFAGTIATTCARSDQLTRTTRRGLTDRQAVQRIKHQLPMSEVARRATFVINTSCPIQAVQAQVTMVHAQLKEASK